MELKLEDMMGAKSKAKGSRYERRCAKLLSDFTGESFRRTPASGGFNKQGAQVVAEHVFSGDLICDNKDFLFSVEAKSQKKFSFTAILKSPKTAAFTEWWEQCVGDANTIKKLPLLIFKPNTQDDFVALDDAGMIQLELINGPNSCQIPNLRLNVYDGLPTPNILQWHAFIKSINAERFFDGMLRQG